MGCDGGPEGDQKSSANGGGRLASGHATGQGRQPSASVRQRGGADGSFGAGSASGSPSTAVPERRPTSTQRSPAIVGTARSGGGPGTTTAGPRSLRQVSPPGSTRSGASTVFQRTRGTASADASRRPASEVAV